jgi:uroporphyrinogen decarboxylase
MDSRERVIRTLEFNQPDRIPVDLWTLPAAFLQYGKALEDLLEASVRDIIAVAGPLDIPSDPHSYEIGTHTDDWGCVWTKLQAGMIGEVKKPVFNTYEQIDTYRAPVEKFKSQWREYRPELENKTTALRGKGQFILGGWISLFERMQFLRGTEDLYCDLAEQNDGFFKLAEIVMAFYREYLKAWLETDVDGITFGDDWGSQRALLISPHLWREIFKPLYQELFTMVKAKGKYIFFHSDGYILDLYPEFIELGVNAINSQLWCMGVEKVAEKFAGKITFWGEISRQETLPHGTPEDVRAAAEKIKKYLFVNGGGLIGQSETGRDVPFENIKTALTCWNT